MTRSQPLFSLTIVISTRTARLFLAKMNATGTICSDADWLTELHIDQKKRYVLVLFLVPIPLSIDRLPDKS